LAASPLPEAIRGRFPIFGSKVYLNSCSQGALSDAVRAAYDHYLTDWDERGAPWGYWMEKQEEARASFAGLVGATVDEVAVTTSVSAGVSAIASGLDLRGRTVVVSNYEFPTIGQIWHAQEARGATIVHVPAAEPGRPIPLERFAEAIDDRTALVSITAVCYRNGALTDIAGVVELARRHGALVLLDAYQAAGTMPLDVRALDVDFLATGVLKYLLGSAGLGFLYARRELIEGILPTETGWFADRDIFEMDIFDYSPAPTAARFQSGTPPIPSIYAGVAGMELMQEIGIAETRAHVLGLTDRLIAGVDELGGRVVTPREHASRGALVCIASTDDHALVAALAAEGIEASCRDGNLRISPHCYNSAGDIDAVLASLRRHHALLVRGDA
jgi:selenocysteine lyase/cysteine desulfurase